MVNHADAMTTKTKTEPMLDDQRQAISTLVRWCPVAETWQPSNEPTCLWDECLEGRTSHRLRLRRGHVCSVCEQVNWTRGEFRAHICYSAY